MMKSIALAAVAGAAVAASGQQEVLAWWNFNASEADSNLTWIDGDDNSYFDSMGTRVFRHMHDNDGFFFAVGTNNGFFRPDTERYYPVHNLEDPFINGGGPFGVSGALIDPSVIDSDELVPDLSMFGAFIDLSDLAGSLWQRGNFGDITDASDIQNDWGSFGGRFGLPNNRPDGDDFGGGSLSFTGPLNNGANIDIHANLADYQSIELSFDSRSSSSGTDDRTISVSTDGGSSFSVVAMSGSGLADGNWRTETYDLGSAADNAADAVIRIESFGAANPNSSTRLDNIVLRGTFGQGVDCPGDLADSSGFGPPDGMVDFGDFFALSFFSGACGAGTTNPDCTGDFADGSGFGPPDGVIDFGDFFALSFLSGPCP